MFFAVLWHQPTTFLESFWTSMLYGNPDEVRLIFQGGAPERYIAMASHYSHFVYSPKNMTACQLRDGESMLEIMPLLIESGLPMKPAAFEELMDCLNDIDDASIYAFIVIYKSRFLGRERIQFCLLGSDDDTLGGAQ